MKELIAIRGIFGLIVLCLSQYGCITYMVVAISLYHLIEFLKLVSVPLDIVNRQKFPTFLVDFPNRLATFMAREFCYRSFPLPSLRAFCS
jgi:hypothetical protein